jgi:hypothetical protein
MLYIIVIHFHHHEIFLVMHIPFIFVEMIDISFERKEVMATQAWRKLIRGKNLIAYQYSNS